MVAEYAMLRQEAWRRFTTCRLENGDTIDVFIDRLEWIGGRVGMSNHDLSFKAQFYNGLPTSVYDMLDGQLSVQLSTSPYHCGWHPSPRSLSRTILFLSWVGQAARHFDWRSSTWCIL